MKQLITLVLTGALAATAVAQSFNIDLDVNSGPAAGPPSFLYNGIANQPGTWNAIRSTSSTTTTLLNLDGSTSAVTFTRATNGTWIPADDFTTSGSFEDVADDIQRVDNFGVLDYSFNNLAAGTYVLYTYAGYPNNASTMSAVQVDGTSSQLLQYVGGTLAGNSYIPGVTHAIHLKTVPAGGSISIHVSASFLGWGTVAGFQLVKLETPRLRYYVDDSAWGTEGTSWDYAWNDLQRALRAATLAGGSNVEIWVAQGFYRPTSGTDRTQTFELEDGLYLYGGFSGDETSLSERQFPEFFITALTGAIGGSSQTDNSYHVVTAVNAGTNTIIDGFSIVRGYASGSGDDTRGAGLFLENASIQVRNCKFLFNMAEGDGGAVVTTASNPRFVNCLFKGNEAQNGSGGAIYHHTSGQLSVYSCEFLANSAIGDGGAIKCLFAPSLIANSFFTGNTSSFDEGGAIAIAGDDGDNLTLTNCTVSLNHSGTAVGGLHVSTGADAAVNNCIFWGNTDPTGGPLLGQQIAAVSGHGSTATLSYSTVQGAGGSAGMNPQFVDADGADNLAGNEDDNCRLMISSPAIDAGSNNLLVNDFGDLDQDGNTIEWLPLDLDGDLRRFNVPSVPDTGFGAAPLVDRGAFEYQFFPGDLNCDGVVNFGDINPFVLLLSNPAQWQISFPNCVSLNGDINGDGQVNFADINPFVALLTNG